jgi:hypothetical protein
MAALIVASASSLLHAQSQCGNYTLAGTYVFTYEGTVMTSASATAQPVAVPFAILGVAWTDYQANWAGGLTMSFGGQIIELEFADINTQVNPDCSGTVTWTAKVKGTNTVIPGQGVWKLFVTPDGSEVRSIVVQGLTGKPVVVGTWKRVAVRPPIAW